MWGQPVSNRTHRRSGEGPVPFFYVRCRLAPVVTLRLVYRHAHIHVSGTRTRRGVDICKGLRELLYAHLRTRVACACISGMGGHSVFCAPWRGVPWHAALQCVAWRCMPCCVSTARRGMAQCSAVRCDAMRRVQQVVFVVTDELDQRRAVLGQQRILGDEETPAVERRQTDAVR